MRRVFYAKVVVQKTADFSPQKTQGLFDFIKNNRFEETFRVAEILLKDRHDLIHKAIGWMLREIGNRNLQAEEDFLKKHYKKFREQHCDMQSSDFLKKREKNI